MAQVNLDPAESFIVAGGNNTISGSTAGRETVTILGGVNTFTPDFNAGGDRIILAGSVFQYTFQRSGSSVVIRGPNGTVVTFPAPNPNLAADRNPVISFVSGGDYVLDSTPAGVFTLSSGEISLTIKTTPTALAIIEPPPPIGLKVTMTDVWEGGTIVATLTLQEAVNREIRVDVATLGGTATPNADYVPISQTVVFAPFQTVQFVTIVTIDDLVTETDETIVMRVSRHVSVYVTGDSDLSATIAASDVINEPAPLTTGPDRWEGTAGPDRYVGAADITRPFKMLSADDVISGGGGVDAIELTNGTLLTLAIADTDFTGVSSIETLVTDYATIELGANAARAGIVTLDSQTRTDARAIGGNAVPYGAQIDLSSDVDANGIADFGSPIAARLSNSGADTVRLQLSASAGSTFDTGTTFTTFFNPTTTGPIDTVMLVRQVDPVRVTLSSAAVGDGSAFATDGITLAVRLQAQDATGALTGQATRFDDEGIRFTGATFTVDDGVRLSAGFTEVLLGTKLADTLTASGAGAAYIGGGLGDDRITGGGGADMLIGGGGADVFVYTAAGQSRGAAYDTLPDFQYGVDTIDLPGAARSVTRVAAGPLDAANLDAQLSAFLSTTLAGGGALLVTSLGGTLDGATFLVADGNGVAGYQAGEDFVIRLPDPPASVPGVLIV